MSPLIAKDTLEEIRARSDIVSVIETFFPLQRHGQTLKALCPFHQEKTPSFTVHPHKQIFHCFGCGKGGDVFRFVMEHEKLDFYSAVKLLAERAGVPLQREDTHYAQRRSEREQLFEINRAAADFYHRCLKESRMAESARRYLAERALDGAAIDEFMLGYAPDQWDALLQQAQRKYQPELLERAGLVIRSAKSEQARWYDRFRNRLLFPIRDEQGRVMGFSGRILAGDAEGAKYVNTPETPIFHKGHILYGLDLARRAISDADRVVICEGQIDVIQCHLADFRNAVAVQGTAFTEEHARILRRYSENVTLVFDADSAGQKAALRAGEVFLQAGLAVRVAVLPQGADPDTMLRTTDGKPRFREILDQAQSLVSFQVETLRNTSGWTGTEGEILQAARAVLDLIRHCPGAVQQSLMIKEAAGQLGLLPDVLQRELQRRPSGVRSAPARPETPAVPGAAPRELALVEHLVADPELSRLTRQYLPMEFIRDEHCRRIAELCAQADETGRPLLELLTDLYNDDEELMQFAAKMLAAPPKITSDFATCEESVKNLILSLRQEAAQRRRNELQQLLLRHQAQPTDMTEAKLRALQEEYAELGYDVARLKSWEQALAIME